MNTLELVEAVKEKYGLPSDYAVAKYMEIKQQTLSQWRSKGGTMDDENAVKFAQKLGLMPEVVLNWTHAERSKCPAAKVAFEHAAQKLAGTAAAMVIGITLAFGLVYSAPAPADESPTMVIM